MYIPANGIAPPAFLTRRRAEMSEAMSSLFGKRLALFRNGRQAFLAGLRAMDAHRPRRIWMPAYIEDVAVEPAVLCGFDVRFYDLSDALGSEQGYRLARDGDLVLVVHYFGLMSPRFVAHSAGHAGRITVVEDCAHALPDPDAARRIGSWGSMAFFSLRKQLPVPDGGILIVNDPSVPLPISPSFRPTRWKDAMKLFALTVEEAAFHSGTNVLSLKGHLRASGQSHTETPAILEGMSLATLRMMAAMDLKTRAQRKKANYRNLAGRLSGIAQIQIPVPEPTDGSVPQMLPVLVENPDRWCRVLRQAGIAACRWPGHIARAVALDEYPVTRRWCNGAVLLPIHESLRERHLVWIADVMNRAARPQ